MLNLGGPAGAIVLVMSTGQQVLAAPPCKAAEVMVEGETLLVLLLCAPCQQLGFARELK